ncbi:endonuclease/exonuclease/phosphatase family protein [Roseomonas elaeocarpi]|uniref:Endonuclease/exonuclease/phosphatase family protein n=1 Tax=Roseomonas elaeocarpi TaxID=907779 RepID=A0ABV6JTN2_9PROT
MRRLIPRILTALLLLAAAPLQAQELKLATWNLDWLTTRAAGDPRLPPDVRGRSPEDLARLRGYAARLGADVLALQEVDGPEAAALILDPAQWTLFFPAESDVQRVAIAVRRGIPAVQNPDLAALDTQPEAEHSLRRGVDVTVTAGGQPLRLLAVHLKSGCREAPLGEGAACNTLADQTGVLAGWIAARGAENAGFAVLGDFNRRMDRPRDPVLVALRRAAPLLRTTEGVSNPCWGGRPFIDHILLGGPARGWLRPDSLRVMVYAETGDGWRDRLSDHCPVSVRLLPP